MTAHILSAALCFASLCVGALIGWSIRSIIVAAAADDGDEVIPQPPTALSEFAAMRFAALEELRVILKDERFKIASEMAYLLGPAADLTREILADDKAELITKMTEEHDLHRTLREMMVSVKKDANRLIEMMDLAEARLAAALANAEIKPAT
jgi:hypothetical protein